jgi:hypothetical protein
MTVLMNVVINLGVASNAGNILTRKKAFPGQEQLYSMESGSWFVGSIVI